MSVVYQFTNRVNGKSYIGFSTDVDKRIKKHHRDSKKVDSKFYRATRKYGWDAFDFTILYKGTDDNFTHTIMEPYFVRKHNTFEEGYNGDEGGLGVIGAVRDTVWVTNGEQSLRRDPEDIPEGFYKGRASFKKSYHPPWSKDRKPRRTYEGDNNPAAKAVIGEGRRYSTRKSAAEANGVSPGTILYWIQNKENWCYENKN